MVEKCELIERAAMPTDFREFGNGRETAAHTTVDSLVGNHAEDRHDPIRVGKRQRVQKSSFQQREECRIATNADTQHKNNQERDTFMASKETWSHGQVVAKGAEALQIFSSENPLLLKEGGCAGEARAR